MKYPPPCRQLLIFVEEPLGHGRWILPSQPSFLYMPKLREQTHEHLIKLPESLTSLTNYMLAILVHLVQEEHMHLTECLFVLKYAMGYMMVSLASY